MADVVRFFKDIFSKEENIMNLSGQRMNICRTCKFFSPKTERCQKCGCFMKLKTKVQNAKCPVGM